MPLNDALPTLLPQARVRALSAMNTLGTPRSKYPKLYADNFNATLRAEIDDDPIDGWNLLRSSSGLHLRNDDTGLMLRFLKEFKFEGKVPPAGHNRRRREAWAQPAILDQEAVGDQPLKNVDGKGGERVRRRVPFPRGRRPGCSCPGHDGRGLSVREVKAERPILLSQMFAGAFDGLEDPARPVVPRAGIEGFLGIPFELANEWCDNGLTEKIDEWAALDSREW